MPFPPPEPNPASYESLRMTTDALSILLGLPFDEAHEADEKDPSLKWKAALEKPGLLDLSQMEINDIEKYLVEYDKYLKELEKSKEQEEDPGYGGAPGYYDKNDGYGGSPRSYGNQENNYGGHGGSSRYYGNSGSRGGSSLGNYPGSGKRDGMGFGGVAQGAIEKGGWEAKPGSSANDQRELAEHEREHEQEMAAGRQKEIDDWNRKHGKDSSSDDPPPPPEPDDPDDGGPPPTDTGGGGGGPDGGGDGYGDDNGDFFGGLTKKNNKTSRRSSGPAHDRSGAFWGGLGQGTVGSDAQGWDSTHPKANDGDGGGVQPGTIGKKKEPVGASGEPSDKNQKKKQNRDNLSFNDGQVEGWEGTHPKMLGLVVATIQSGGSRGGGSRQPSTRLPGSRARNLGQPSRSAMTPLGGMNDILSGSIRGSKTLPFS